MKGVSGFCRDNSLKDGRDGCDALGKNKRDVVMLFLAAEVTDGDLNRLFGRFAEVNSIRIRRDPLRIEAVFVIGIGQ